MATATSSRPSLQLERPSRPSLQIDTNARPSLQLDTTRRPSLTLFPPPPKPIQPIQPKAAPRRQDSLNWNSRPAAPKPAAQNAKQPGDFHELIIRVDSPTSVSTVAAPARAYIAPSSPKQSAHALSPPQQRIASPDPVSAVEGGYSPQINQGQSSVSPISKSSPNTNTLDRTNSKRSKAASPTPTTGYGRMATATPTQQHRVSESIYSPDQKRAPSPAFSDIRSARSGSPTLVRSNSAATTHRAPSELPLMRSIFPTYDFSKSLTQQQYVPTQALPESIPMQIISKAPYSPEAVGTFASSAREPYFTPAAQLSSLWEAANGDMRTVSPRLFTLQAHLGTEQKPQKPSKGKSKNARKKSQLSFGPSETQGFYTVTQEEAHPSDDMLDPTEDHEVLVLRHHPTEPNSLPIAHLNVRPPPHLSTITRSYMAANASNTHLASPNPSIASPSFAPGLQEAVYLVTTIFSKLAALQALEHAAASPEAARIAEVDPNATSPAAAQLAEYAVRDAEELQSCDLLWIANSAAGRYELRHPLLGVFPVRVEGDVGKRFGPSQPEAQSAYRPKTQARVSIYAPPRSPDGPFQRLNSDPLASLDLASGALTLDAASMQELNNAFLIDVLATTLFAVAVSESKRGEDPAMVFAAPPVSPMLKGKGKGKAKDKAPSVKKLKAKAKEVIQENDLDLEAARKNKELPRATRGVLSLLGLGLKMIIWVLELGVKMLARIIVGISNRAGKL